MSAPATVRRPCLWVLATVALLLLAGWLLLVAPLSARWAESEAHIAKSAALLERLLGIAAQRESVQARLQSIEARQKASGHYLAHGTPALAATEMQRTISSFVEASGGQLASTQVLPAASEGEYVRIPIRVQFSGDTNALQGTLYRVERATPLLFVDEMTVRSRVVRQRRRGPDDPDHEETVLTVDLQVSGFMRSREGGRGAQE